MATDKNQELPKTGECAVCGLAIHNKYGEIPTAQPKWVHDDLDAWAERRQAGDVHPAVLAKAGAK